MNGTSIQPEHLAYKPPKTKKGLQFPKGKNLLFIVIALIVLEGVATQIYLSTHRKPAGIKHQTKLQTNLADPEQQEQKKQSEVIVEAVKQKVTLPEGEEPILATVSNPEALKNQKFFSYAQVGDKILMYRKAKKVFLYRPSTDEVLAQAPLKYDGAVAGASTSVNVTPF